GAVGRQPVVPVDEAGLEGLLDQQAAETGAVDEQVALHHLAVLEHQGLDETVLRILAHLAALALAAIQAAALALAAHERRVQRRVEVVGVADVAAAHGRGRLDPAHGPLLRVAIALVEEREALLARGGGLQAVVAERRLGATAAALQPELVEVAGPGVDAGGAERVEVVVARATPVLEGDRELEASGHRLHELAL